MNSNYAARTKTKAVVAAVITNRRGEVLIARRSNISDGRQTIWEFPGGKVEPGENPVEALIREIREELNLEIDVAGLLGKFRAILASEPVEFLFYQASMKTGKLNLSVHKEIRWVKPMDIDEVMLSKPDRKIARLIKNKT